MATRTHRSMLALGDATVQRIRNLAASWKAPQTGVVRRAVLVADQPARLFRDCLLPSSLLLALLAAPPGVAAPEPEKIKSVVLGRVAKAGVYQLSKPATLETALKAAGGWKPCEIKSCFPPKNCLLKIKNSQGGYSGQIKIAICVDRATGKVTVTDSEWQTLPLPDSCLIEMPHVDF